MFGTRTKNNTTVKVKISRNYELPFKNKILEGFFVLRLGLTFED